MFDLSKQTIERKQPRHLEMESRIDKDPHDQEQTDSRHGTF